MPRKPRLLNPNELPTKRQTDKARLAIKTSWIVRRLQQNFAGELDEPLTPSQLKSAELLLARTMPVLQSVEVTQDPEVPKIGPHEAMAQLEEYIKELPEHRKQQLLSGNLIELKA